MSESKWGTQEWYRKRPIFFTPEDMKRSKEELIEEIRRDLGRLRGKLSDIYHAFGWKDRLDAPEHGITLVIMALHYAVEEMRKVAREKAFP